MIILTVEVKSSSSEVLEWGRHGVLGCFFLSEQDPEDSDSTLKGENFEERFTRRL